ncbi:MAG TPA: hypothetical protein VGP19_04810 [Candidatus Acidoferrales bacterium]|nr:hypothetical protein [Candidatus Acidoferrales bacterium]
MSTPPDALAYIASELISQPGVFFVGFQHTSLGFQGVEPQPALIVVFEDNQPSLKSDDYRGMPNLSFIENLEPLIFSFSFFDPDRDRIE